MIIFIIDFGMGFSISVAAPTRQKAIEWAVEKFPTRKIIDITTRYISVVD